VTILGEAASTGQAGGLRQLATMASLAIRRPVRGYLVVGREPDETLVPFEAPGGCVQGWDLA